MSVTILCPGAHLPCTILSFPTHTDSIRDLLVRSGTLLQGKQQTLHGRGTSELGLRTVV